MNSGDSFSQKAHTPAMPMPGAQTHRKHVPQRGRGDAGVVLDVAEVHRRDASIGSMPACIRPLINTSCAGDGIAM